MDIVALVNVASTPRNDFGIRLEAILALCAIEGMEPLWWLGKVAEADMDAAWMVAEGVSRRQDGAALLGVLARHDHFYVRLVVADALGVRNDCIDLLEGLACDDEDERVRLAGARSMARRFGF